MRYRSGRSLCCAYGEHWHEGLHAGVASGMGAATADGVYGLIAGFGITFISNFLFSHSIILRLIGGCILCYLGIRIFLTVPGGNPNSGVENGLVHDYVSTFLLTLTNPMTLIAFAAIFAAAGVGDTHGNYLGAAVLVGGVVLGSALWWLILCGIVGCAPQKGQRQGAKICQQSFRHSYCGLRPDRVT